MVEKMDRALEKAAVGQRCHGEGGRWAVTLGRGGDTDRQPTPGRRGGTVEHCRGTAVERLLERTSEREAFGEDECVKMTQLYSVVRLLLLTCRGLFSM